MSFQFHYFVFSNNTKIISENLNNVSSSGGFPILPSISNTNQECLKNKTNLSH